MTGSRESWDVRFYRRLAGAVPELRPCLDDVVETYEDVRSEALRTRGQLGLALAFLRVLGPLLVAVLLTEERRIPGVRATAASIAQAWWRDARGALRSLRREPRFGFAVVLLVATSIGITTTIFSVVDAVLLRPLPYPEADRLVLFTEPTHSGRLVERWKSSLSRFDDLTAVWEGDAMDLVEGGRPQRVEVARVEPSFFSFFGIRPLHGRLFGIGDLEPGTRTVVLTHGFWAERFGADPDIVGKTVRLDGDPWDVVGVLEPRARLPEIVVGQRVDLLRPLDPSHPWLAQWEFSLLQVVGRLRDGATLEGAQAEVDAVAALLAKEVQQMRESDGSPSRTPLAGLQEATVESVREGLGLLLAAVGFMLAIACANIANLVLARGTEREHELALRRALGASRFGLLRQLLVESVTLSLLGGVIGVGLARLGLLAFDVVRPEDLPRFGEVSIDPRVVVFALGAAVVSGLAFGLVPAFGAAGAEARALVVGRSRVGTGRRGARTRSALVVVEVALALVLLCGAGILGHSLLGLARQDPGFETERLVRLRLWLGELLEPGQDSGRMELVEEVMRSVSSVPGVESVGAAWNLPFDITGNSRCCWARRFDATSGDQVRVMLSPVTPGYFGALGIPLLAGRTLELADETLEPPPIVLSRRSAAVLFPGVEDGELFSLVGRNLGSAGDPAEYRVIGVVDDVLDFGLDQRPEPILYLSYSRLGEGLGRLSVGVRLREPLSADMSEALRAAVWSVDPEMPLGEVLPVDDMIWSSLRTRRFYSTLFGTFAALALALAALGIASSLLYVVGRRRRELGLRMALGARGGDVVRLVVRQALGWTALGALLGLCGGIALTRALGALVHGLGSVDPQSLVVASVLLVTVALAATVVPALAAARTDPARTLRSS